MEIRPFHDTLWRYQELQLKFKIKDLSSYEKQPKRVALNRQDHASSLRYSAV